MWIVPVTRSAQDVAIDVKGEHNSMQHDLGCFKREQDSGHADSVESFKFIRLFKAFKTLRKVQPFRQVQPEKDS